MFIKFFSKLIKTLTFSRVMVYTLTIFAAIVFFTIYENRSVIFDRALSPSKINAGLTFSIGEQTADIVKQRVIADENILGISIVSANLRSNEAETVFGISDDETLNRVMNSMEATGYYRLPLFSATDENNADIVRLINGEFGCTNFNTTLLSRIYPELNDSVKMVCQTSIPSYYGYFSGYLTIFLAETYDADRQQILKLSVDKLATDIYFRDVIPTQKAAK